MTSLSPAAAHAGACRASLPNAVVATTVAALLLLTAGSAPLPAQTASGSVPAPRRIWAAQTSPRELRLVWDPVPGASGFRVYRGSGETVAVLGNASANSQQWIVPITTAMLSSPQQFAIEALDASRRPSARAAFNVVTPITVTPGGGAVPAPAAVTATEGGGGITVTWDAVPGATAYAIGRAVAPGGFRVFCRICSTSTTLVDTNVTPGAKHQYSIAAVTPRGTGRATRSNDVTPGGGGGIVAGGGGTGGTGGTGSTDSTGGTGGSTTLTIPPPPTNLSVRKLAETSYEFSWTGTPGSTSYRLSRALCSQSPQVVATVPAAPWTDNLTETMIGSACGTAAILQPIKVAYSIVAANTVGASTAALWPPFTLSLLTSGTGGTGGTGGSTLAVPPAPVSLAVRKSPNAPTLIELTWQGGTGAETFRISRTVCRGGPQQVASVPFGAIGLSRPWTDTIPASPIRTYCPKDFLGTYTVDVMYAVAAVNAAGSSVQAPSPRLSFTVSSAALDRMGTTTTTTTTTLAAPLPLSASAAGPMAVALNWQTSAGATAYELYRALCGGTAQFAKAVTPTAGSPNVVYTDYIPWTTINTTSPIGATSGSVVYSVAAKDASGATSAQSKFPSVPLTFGQMVVGTSPPTSVSGARAYATSSGTVVLNWAVPVNASQVQIERALGPKGAFTFLTMLGRVSSYTDTTAGVATQQPAYRIIALNGNGAAPGVVVTLP